MDMINRLWVDYRIKEKEINNYILYIVLNHVEGFLVDVAQSQLSLR